MKNLDEKNVISLCLRVFGELFFLFYPRVLGELCEIENAVNRLSSPQPVSAI